MKRYGLRIGDTGVEFPSREERQKAMIAFTIGTCTKISDYGIRFTDGKDAFSTYERDDKEILANCSVCNGVFGIETCGIRKYPNKPSYSETYSVEEQHICDACLANQSEAKKLFDAQAIVAKAENTEAPPL